MQRFPSYKKPKATSKPLSYATSMMAIVAVLFGAGAVTMAFANSQSSVVRTLSARTLTVQPVRETNQRILLVKTSPPNPGVRTTEQVIRLKPVPQDKNDKSEKDENTKKKISTKLTFYRSALDRKLYLEIEGVKHLIADIRVAKTWGLPAVLPLKNDRNEEGTTVGTVIRLKPGSLPIKIRGNTDVYIATGGGVLHKVSTSAIAELYWGKNWKSQVYVLPSALVKRYTTGEVITTENAKKFVPKTLPETVITNEL